MQNNKERKSIAIIGSGFSSLSAAAYLAKAGHQVTIYEKNERLGGRARQFEAEGYVFDMGPSWYWMPDVFDKFFHDFGHQPSDFYQLQLLEPSFTIIYHKNDALDIAADFDQLCQQFEEIEPGSAAKLIQFLDEAAYKYKVGIDKLVYKPGQSITEFLDIDLIKGLFKLQVFTSFSKHVRKFFKHPKLVSLMEFPVLFLGAMPKETPALYSLMNYAGLKLGTWYPQGGFGEVIKAMASVCSEQGVNFRTNEAVERFEYSGRRVVSICTNKGVQKVDAIIAGADYHHIEQKLLPPEFRNYDESYWNKRIFAPSALIFYIGVAKKIKRLNHHNLFFDTDFELHAEEIYHDPKWPSNPLFYVCCPSKTDESVAPEGHENLFLLMPLAPGIEDSESNRKKYFDLMMTRLENYAGQDIRSAIDYERSYCLQDFIEDYNAYKGNAYGLSNTLLQTANLKPSIKNKKLSNFYYTGQLTVPGPGVPPSIISGKVAAQELIKSINRDFQ